LRQSNSTPNPLSLRTARKCGSWLPNASLLVRSTACHRLQRFLLVLLFLGVAAGNAQDNSEALSLAHCIELARGAPSTVKRARAQLDAAKYAVRGARANFLPQVSIANGFTYNSPLLYDRNTFSFVALNGIREYSSAATTTLEVDSSGRLRAIYDRARANRAIAEAGLAMSDRDLTRAVSAAYYRVLLTRKLAASANDNLQAARDFETKVRQLVDGGEASQADLTKASLETALLEQTADSMKVEAEMAEHDLASYWTTDVANRLVLADDLDHRPPAPSTPSENAPYLKRPEFRLFAAQVAGFNADARQARAQMLPQLNLSFQYGIDSTHVTSRDRGYAGFIHLDIPVFDFLRARSEQRQFQSVALAAQTDQSISTRLLSKEYQDALSQVNGTYAQIETTERQVSLAKDNLRLSRLRFESGEGTALDVVTAQSALVQADIDFYTTRANYLNAISVLKVASGQ
jgi:outer membrane protein TolC